MMNIAFFVDNLCTKGGVERITSILSNELSPYYNIGIITLFEWKEIEYSINNKISIYNLNSKKVFGIKIFLLNVIGTVNIIRKNKIDTVLVMGRTHAIVILIARLFVKFRVIFCEHNTLMLYSFFDKGFIKNIKRYIFQTLINLFSSKIVVLTLKEKNLYKKRFPFIKHKIVQIYNFVDPKLLHSNKNYDISSKKILTVGRIDFQKGLEYLIDVAKNVFDRHPDWCWDVYGDGDDLYTKRIIEKIKSNNISKQLILKGSHSNIYDIYYKYSLYVMTSRFEGMPMVLLEAKSKKLPIVSFDINSGPSDIIRDKIDGFLVHDFDCIEMADKICLLIENHELRKNFSDNARTNLCKFKMEKVLEQWRNLIDNI